MVFVTTNKIFNPYLLTGKWLFLIGKQQVT